VLRSLSEGKESLFSYQLAGGYPAEVSMSIKSIYANGSLT